MPLSEEEQALMRMRANADRNHAWCADFIAESVRLHRETVNANPELGRQQTAGRAALRLMFAHMDPLILCGLLGIAIDLLARQPVTAAADDDLETEFNQP